MKAIRYVLILGLILVMALMAGPLQVLVSQALRSVLAFLAGIIVRDVISFMRRRRQALIAMLFLATFLAGFLSSYTLVSIT